MYIPFERRVDSRTPCVSKRSRKTPALLTPILFLATIPIIGCGAQGMDTDNLAPISTEDPFESIESPIYAGDDVPGKSGLVKFTLDGSMCTGTMIGPALILTAAHCLPATGTAGSAQISYYRPGRSATLIQGEDLGAHTVVTAVRNGDYDGDINHDIGMLILSDPNKTRWNKTDYHDYVRVYRAGTMPNWFYTYGAGLQWRNGNGVGVLRVGHFERLSLYPLRAVLNTGDEGICDGDSGGPSMLTGGGQEMVAGVTSSGEGGEDCSDHGDDWHFTRPSGTNGEFLRSFAPECKIMNASGGYDYLRCFTLPFISDVTDVDVKYSKRLAVALVTTTNAAAT